MSGFYVATNRQRPPEDNAFARRARSKRREPEPEPVKEVTPLVDSAPVGEVLPLAEAKAQVLLAAAAAEVSVSESEPDPEPKRGGRVKSQATIDREAKVLMVVRNAEQVGVTKADLAALVEATPQQVNAALQALASEGKVRSAPKPDSKALLWFAA